MMRIILITISLTFLNAIHTLPLYSRPLTVGDGLMKQKMGRYIDYCIDRSGKATVADMSSPAFRDKFKPLPKEDYSFGYSKAAIWLRVAVANRTERPFAWVLECEYPLIDDICFYGPKGKEYAAVCTGDRKPFSTRTEFYRTFLFPVDSPPGESACYIRMTSGGSLNVSFKAWGEASLKRNIGNESIILWMYYGIMLSLFIYNLFIFTSLRETSYLYLSLFTVSVALFSACHTGLAFQYLWPDSPAWANIAHPLFTNTSLVLVIQFTRGFLGTRAITPRHDRFLQVFLFITLLLVFIVFFISYFWATQISTSMAAFSALNLIIIGTRLLVMGSRQARFYMAAWISFMLGVVLIMLHAFGIIHEGFLSNWGYQIGSSLVVILLSLGIADKINIMRHEREQALDATREAEEKYRALIETTETGFVIVDGEGNVMDANAEYARLTGHLAVQDIIGRGVLEWTSPAEREKNAEAVALCMRQGFIRNLEVEYIHQDGTIVPVEINATVIDSKKGIRILSVCRDITHRKMIFDNLQASLREKEILLMEIHHRVKNNLQIISSLIALQMGEITDGVILMLYEDLNSRIRAMSLIHERLYQSSDFARIDFAEYINLIVNDLQNSYRHYCPSCSIEFDTDHIELDIVKAIPCGLMLNEIVSNTFKYAFPPSHKVNAKIVISFHEKDNENIELTVSDNGVGLPEAIDPKQSKTLGLSLIFLLSDQIKGTIQVDRGGGTKYTITFSKE